MNNKGDNMTNDSRPTINDMMSKIWECIDTYSKKIHIAPEFAKKDKIFGVKPSAKWMLKNERNACLRDIVETATLYGYDLYSEYQSLKGIATKVHEEPEQGAYAPYLVLIELKIL